ncbi:MAG: PAS domain-containing sensor histidine kinase [Candidatus Gastranaerophilales bacterium]|nr:PAS domain-containing sensor histidine kinase [Candidatus Gastranaerophilales bacterium]
MGLFKQLFSKQSAILDFCPEAVFITDVECNVSYANPAALFLCGAEVSEITSLYDFFPNEDIKLNEEKQLKRIFFLKSKKGDEKYVEIKSEKLPDEDKYLVVILDVTSNHKMVKSLERKIEEDEKVKYNKNEFLHKMSNNLTSPLHSIIGFSQAILEGLGGDINDKQEKYLKIIHKNSSELLQLLDKVINLSQIEADLYEISFKNFDITNTASIAINEVKAKLDEKRLSIDLDTEELTRKNCYSDETVVKTILLNLLENAVLSCDLGGVKVKLANPEFEYFIEKGIKVPTDSEKNEFLLIQVRDTGSGISKDEMKDIFDPYIQIDKNAKKHLLRGLLLGITKEFVKQLKGLIWVDSELLKESVYSIIIPVEKNPVQLEYLDDAEKNDSQVC